MFSEEEETRKMLLALSMLHQSATSNAGAWFLIGLFGTIIVGIASNIAYHLCRKMMARLTRHH